MTLNVRPRSETLHNCYYRDFVGDVTAYSADNPKDELNHVRAEILDGCANRIRALLEDRTAGVASYERVIVASHSLGTVVAYAETKDGSSSHGA